MVQKHSSLAIERLRVVSRSEDVRLAEIRRGGGLRVRRLERSSGLALQRFTGVMSELPTTALDLVVLATTASLPSLPHSFLAHTDSEPEATARRFGSGNNKCKSP